MQTVIRSALAFMLMFAFILQTAAPASAYARTYYRTRIHQNYGNRYYRYSRGTYWQRHPKVKAAAIGAGVGAGAGALTGLIAHTGIMRGAMIGAGTGAGVGLIRSSHIMRRHPIMRDIATGGVAGLGFGWAASRHGGAGKGLLVGSALGLGMGLLTHRI